MTRLLVVTADVLRPQMAGPAMRAWHIAEQLATDNEVHLVTTSPYCEVQPDGFVAQAVGPEALAKAEGWCEVMVLQGYVMLHYPVLAASQKIIVFDVYDPLHLETLALTTGHRGQARDDHVRLSVSTLNDQLARADFLMCASSRQRDLFLGQLCALGRVNALTYNDDPTLRTLIDVVPFGLPDEPPQHTKAVLRGVVPGIGRDDDVLVWAGGVYNWFDPLTLIRAVAQVAVKRPSVRLYFMGMRHPNPDVPEMEVAGAARALATELGIAGVNVFFNEGWVDYADRQDYLTEATLGVSMHYESAETRFSFRTRQLDYLWATLPVVATEGDYFAELIETEGLGRVVPPQDPDRLAQALLGLLEDPALAQACRERAAAVRERFKWSVVVEPLRQFCRQPRRAPDLVAGPPMMLSGLVGRPGAAEPAPSDQADEHALGPGGGPPGPEEAGPVSGPSTAPGRLTPLALARLHYQQGGAAQLAKRAAAKAVRVTRSAYAAKTGGGKGA